MEVANPSESLPAAHQRARPPSPLNLIAEVSPQQVVAELEKHVLVDGFKIVIDLEKSKGSRLVDAVTGRSLIDLYAFYASMPIGYNHPCFNRPEVEADLLAAAKLKVANSDVYSVQLATFIRTFTEVVGCAGLDRYFFIDGGALAVENALKAAMDWKVRKNMARGLGERGTEILHFQGAFHGRSGYTMSVTNTDPRKTDLFAKFPWPRVSAPFIDFSLAPRDRLDDVIEREKQSAAEIRDFIAQRGPDIAAILIEPIQGEGGDRHFRGEWLECLRRICDDNDTLLIFDEVQCGMGATGRNWCCEHFKVTPDLLVFGKKAQVCGVMAGPRLDEIQENVFRAPSRINSTWGGNFCDYVRSTHFLRIIQQERLVENAARAGAIFLEGLQELATRHPILTAVRGRGLLVAFDLPTRQLRDRFWNDAFGLGLLVLRCGERSIRLRPALDIRDDVIDEAIGIMAAVCQLKK